MSETEEASGAKDGAAAAGRGGPLTSGTRENAERLGRPRQGAGGVAPPPGPAQFSTARTDDIEQMSYEQARDELAEVVTKLEAGGAPLEESLALWQRGEALADRCERWLDGATAKLEEVRHALENGNIGPSS